MTEILNLLDHTLTAMMGVPIFAVLMGAFALCVAFGIARTLKRAVGGRA